jgi:hypothetical protein
MQTDMNAIQQHNIKRLRELESVLVAHMEEFVRVGTTLKTIRDERLYKADGYKTFEDYCRKKWDWSRSRAYQIIDSAELRMVLPSPRGPSKDVDNLSTWTEGAVRPLKRLDSPAKARAVAQRAIAEAEKTGKKLTSGMVRKHVDKELGVKRGASAKRNDTIMFEDEVFRWTGKIAGMADIMDGVPASALRHFGQKYPERAQGLAKAIERLEKALARVWERLPD